MLTLATLGKPFILTFCLLFSLFSVVIRGRGGRRVSRGDSSAWRRSKVKRQQVNTLTDPCGRTYVHVWWLHMSASTQAGMFFPPTASDAAVCSADAEKEEDESGTQAQTAAEESSIKVPPVLINTSNTLGSFRLSPYPTSVPPLSSCVQVPKRIEVHSIHTYVALYRFLPQEQNDLELQ